MQVDIYIREKSGKRELRMPLLPEKLSFHSGDATVIEYDIMGLGVVEVPSGTEPNTYMWESAFPGWYRQDDPMIRGIWYDPDDYNRVLNEWKKNGTELNLLVTGYPINDDVFIKEYHATAAGPFGDIYYEIAFTEARKITITTTKEEQQAPETTTRPTEEKKTYTTVSGDTLWAIAKKFYGDGSKWTIIYEANKDIIEKTAKSHGKNSSENGKWIYPGITLVIPDDIKTSSKPTPTTTTNPAYSADRTSSLTNSVSNIKNTMHVK